jgi:PilZ domain-containing protein
VRIDHTVPSEACRRAYPRMGVALAASALAIARSRSVVVTDVSLIGAQIGGRDLPPAGEDMMMLVGSIDAMATVVWSEGDKCGVRFDEAIADETIAQMKREADWAELAQWSH